MLLSMGQKYWRSMCQIREQHQTALQSAPPLTKAVLLDGGVKSPATHVEVELALGHRHRHTGAPLHDRRHILHETGTKRVDRNFGGAMDLLSLELRQHLRDRAVRVDGDARCPLGAAMQPL